MGDGYLLRGSLDEDNDKSFVFLWVQPSYYFTP